MRAFWLHLQNSPIRWTMPILLALDLAILFLRTRYWIGIWPEAGAAAQVPAYLIGPIAGGAAAWSAAAPLRHGVTEQLTAARVHPAVSEAYRLGSTVVILIIPYLAGQAVAFALTARTFPPGLHLWLGYFTLGVFVTLLTASLGWIIGKIFKSVFAALTATLSCLLLVGMMDRGLGSIVVTGKPEVMVDPIAVILRLGLVVTLLTALLWMPISGHVRRHTAIVPALTFLALIATMFATTTVTDREPPGDNVICVHGPTVLCIWPEHKKFAPMLQQINTRIAALPKSFVLPPRVNEFGIEPTGHRVKDGHQIYVDDPDLAPTFNIFEGSPWSAAGDISNAITSATFDFGKVETCNWASRTESDRARLLALGAWLESYLAGGGTPDYRTNAPSDMQAAWSVGRTVANETSRAQQFSWAGQEVNDLRGRYCHQ